ncbi:MAG: HEAT repeat domain-containing protein, partial [Fimbriimonadales bacterium]
FDLREAVLVVVEYGAVLEPLWWRALVGSLEVRRALVQVGEVVIPGLRRALARDERVLALEALKILAEINTDASLRIVLEGLRHPSEALRYQVCTLLENRQRPYMVPPLYERYTQDEASSVRESARNALLSFQDSACYAQLLHLVGGHLVQIGSIPLPQEQETLLWEALNRARTLDINAVRSTESELVANIGRSDVLAWLYLRGWREGYLSGTLPTIRNAIEIVARSRGQSLKHPILEMLRHAQQVYPTDASLVHFEAELGREWLSSGEQYEVLRRLRLHPQATAEQVEYVRQRLTQIVAQLPEPAMRTEAYEWMAVHNYYASRECLIQGTKDADKQVRLVVLSILVQSEPTSGKIKYGIKRFWEKLRR